MVDKIVEASARAALGAVEKSKPSGVYFGFVDSVEPFRVIIDQKLVLTEEFIVLGRYITEFSTDYMIDGETWHGLRKGDELLLLREQGGQRYCVIDWVKRVDEEQRPAWVMTGEVVSDMPEIKVNDYLTLTPENIILCRNVTEYQVDMSVSHNTELETEHTHLCACGGVASATQHLHGYEGRKRFTVHNRLAVGDKVLLVCERSLQKWYVVDFISRAESEIRGEWI